MGAQMSKNSEASGDILCGERSMGWCWWNRIKGQGRKTEFPKAFVRLVIIFKREGPGVQGVFWTQSTIFPHPSFSENKNIKFALDLVWGRQQCRLWPASLTETSGSRE